MFYYTNENRVNIPLFCDFKAHLKTRLAKMDKRRLFLKHLAQTSVAPMGLEIDFAEGIYLYDRSGRRYMDLIAGIGVSSLGHRHPDVEAAVLNQVSRYWHTMVYGEYLLTPQVELAALLATLLPGLDSVYLVNSGTEATEGAMKLAKRVTARPEIISCRYAYHGSTQGAASLMWPTDFTRPYFPLLPGIRHIQFNCDWCLSEISERTAAVIVETVQAESGLTVPRGSWLRALRARCDETGALLILDEIQAGCGRTGHMFAFEAYDVRPDVLLLAKGFGGGMPIGAFIAPQHMMQALSVDPPLGHITTFGGHPVAAAAALATMKVLRDGPWIGEVPKKEALFKSRLRHPAIKELRSAGLWLAVDLDDAAKVQRAIAHCLDAGVITDWFLFNDRSLRIAPPLIITESQIEDACIVLLEAMDALE